MGWRYSLQDTASSLKLKKSGSEYKGPCPCCGGHDRFSMKLGKKHDILVYCRHGCTFGQVMKEAVMLGLADRDNQGPTYSTRDIMYTKMLVAMSEMKIGKGEALEQKEVLLLASMKGSVPGDVKTEISQVLNKNRGLCG